MQDDVDLDATWWCVDVAGGWAHIARQLKHWVDGVPRLWSEKTRKIAPSVHHAYQFGKLYYIKADDKQSAWRLYCGCVSGRPDNDSCNSSDSRAVLRGDDDSERR
jgi:hypothetical protein